MDRRPSLQTTLENLFDRNPHVYFQRPSGNNMDYPCIVYNVSDIHVMHADNGYYADQHAYELTVIDRDPDSNLREKVARLPRCRFARFFVNDNLNHFVFSIIY